MPVTTVLKLDEIKRLIDSPQLIREIEAGFVLYSEGQVVVPPVGFLHVDEPPGDVHIKYGSVFRVAESIGNQLAVPNDEDRVVPAPNSFVSNKVLPMCPE
jgi:ornithine cyclodeaminase/alanine dehydrogenase-like protein (mu-crystallin family)